MTMMLFSILSFAFLAMEAPRVLAGNPQGCLDAPLDPNRDYFPDKVEPMSSTLWDVSYHKTYKIAKNLEDNTQYLLYQCGSEPPTNIPNINLTLSIPLQNGIALSTTTHLSVFELLGVRDEIKAYFGDNQWISSPCMKDRFVSGETAYVQYPDEETAISRLFDTVDERIVLFHNPGFNANVTNRVSATAWKERSNHGIGEWIKYFSVFFNLEAKANEEFQGIYGRYECTKHNAQTILADEAKPKVLVAEFSTFCGGWSVGSCPNFYCDHIRDCSSDILENDNVGSIVNPKCGSDRNYKSTKELVEFAKDADVWIYPGHGDYYWDLAYEEFGQDLDQMKSVQNKQVYDTVLTALNIWYEHRLVEYDLVLEDMCNIVGATHELLPHQRGFLRNVFTEEVGDLGQCKDPSVGFEIRAEECVDLPVLLSQQSAANSPFWEGSMVLGMMLSLVALSVGLVN